MNETNNNLNPEYLAARPRPVLLLLIDGWGVAPSGESNILSQAKTKSFLNLIKEYPVAVLTPGHKSLNARYLSLGAGSDLGDETVASDHSLSAVLAQAGLTQLKISETERFAALTHFFNGGQDEKQVGEDWKIVSSQNGQRTASPLLALKRAVKEILVAIQSDQAPDFIAASLPYLDLQARTGSLEEIKVAAETLDKNLKKIVAAVLAKGGLMFLSSTGGNAERMYHPGTGLADRELTDAPVPLVIIGQAFKGRTIGLADLLNNDLSLLAPAGTLADLAPTILQIMKLDQPVGMTGHGLLALT
jgi:2,3-bisphosphoglycerate-independent phosphoglycerate mutase